MPPVICSQSTPEILSGEYLRMPVRNLRVRLAGLRWLWATRSFGDPTLSRIDHGHILILLAGYSEWNFFGIFDHADSSKKGKPLTKYSIPLMGERKNSFIVLPDCKSVTKSPRVTMVRGRCSCRANWLYYMVTPHWQVTPRLLSKSMAPVALCLLASTLLAWSLATLPNIWGQKINYHLVMLAVNVLLLSIKTKTNIFAFPP